MTSSVSQEIKGSSLGANVTAPIPARYPGFTLGNTAPSSIRIEAFIDLQCAASKRALPTVAALAQRHSGVSVTMVPLVLPSHRQSYYLLKSSLVASNVDGKFDDSQWVNYARFVYEQLDRFETKGHYENKTEEDLLNHVSRVVLEFHRGPEDHFDKYYNLIKSEPWVETLAKAACKVAARRGVVATPTFFVNGVEAIGFDSHSSAEQWDTLIQQLGR